MFEQSLIPAGRTRQPWTIAVAALSQLTLIAILILFPLIYGPELPLPELVSSLTLPLPPPPLPPPPSPPPAQARASRVVPRQFDATKLAAPRTIPKQVAVLNEMPALPEPPMAGVPGGVPLGVPGGWVGGILNAVPAVASPPASAPQPAPQPQPTQIDVGGDVQAARLTHQVTPAYPKLARDARVGGTVILKAVIGTDGRIENLVPISGHPFLVPAAIEAVKQWIYQPTYLNGKPVEVNTEIVVHFTLAT